MGLCSCYFDNYSKICKTFLCATALSKKNNIANLIQLSSAVSQLHHKRIISIAIEIAISSLNAATHTDLTVIN